MEENVEIADGLLEEDDQELAKSVVAKATKKRAAGKGGGERADAKPAAPKAKAASAPSASSSSSSAPASAGGPVVVPRRFTWEGDDLSVAEAQAWAPPTGRVGKDIVRHMRWTGHMKCRPTPPTHCTKAWGDRTRLNSRQALAFVLQTLWSWHTDMTGEPCPYSFEIQR